MNIDEIKKTIGHGTRVAGHAQANMAAVGDRIDEGRRLAAATRSSGHEQLELGRARLEQAAAEAKRAFDLLATAARAAEEFRRALG
jgi:hypothetical protein